MNETYSPSGFKILPPVTKNLLIINGLFYFATVVLAQIKGIDLINLLGLHYFKASQFAPYQFITYMFMHGSFSHVFFNMFAVWMFGTVLEQVWGAKKYLFFYLFTGIGAAIFHYIIFYYQTQPILQNMDVFLAHPSLQTLNQFVSSHKFYIKDAGTLSVAFGQFQQNYALLQSNPNSVQALQAAVSFISEYKDVYLNIPVVVGASGAVFGLLLAFGMLFPNSMIYIYFFIPMKAKWFVIIYGLIELFSGFYDSTSNVAHFAHLGGMLFGLILILYWRKKDKEKLTQHWQ